MDLRIDDVDEPSEELLLARLEALVPILREGAATTEEVRHVAESTIQKIAATGYLGAFRPRRFGGPGLGLSVLTNGARILAHGCASSAWTAVFLAQHVWMLGRMPDAMQEEILGGDVTPLIAGTLASQGTAVKVEGGYRVSGLSNWNSAIFHSTWASMQAVVDGEVYVFYIDVNDVELQDLWHTSGMRGTHSDSFVADAVFVPDVLAVSISAQGVGERHPDQPFIDYPYISAVSLTCSAVALGAAEAAVELFEEKIRSRVLAFSGEEKQVEQPFAQMRLGKAVARVRMARELWNSCIVDLDDSYGTGGKLSVAARIGIRSSCALVVQTCRDVVNDIMNSAGGSSYFLSAPLQRIQRDVEVVKSHAIFDWDRVAQLQGRVQLGMRPADTDLI